MKIVIEPISHDQQRYATLGDWIFKNGNLIIYVSRTGNIYYDFLIGLHELIEAMLCKRKGIKEETVSDFDIKYEKEREEGLHGDKEPGNDINAPYRIEHIYAENVEKMVAHRLGIDWKDYNKGLDKTERKSKRRKK